MSQCTGKNQVPPPRVWRIVEAHKKAADGTVPKFSIQDVPEGMEGDVVEFFMKYMPQEERFCVGIDAVKDPLFMQELREYYVEKVSEGTSIVALTANPDSNGAPVIAGANILTVGTKEHEADSHSIEQFKSKKSRIIFYATFSLKEEADLLNKFGFDKYLASDGLLVDPRYRGLGLGEEMLRVRDDIGRAHEIFFSMSLFTQVASQTAANRAGYDTYLRKEYTEILDDEGNLAYPKMAGEFAQIMAKRFH